MPARKGGIINTRGQGRAARTMGRGRVEKAAEDEHRAKATPPGRDAARPLGPGVQPVPAGHWGLWGDGVPKPHSEPPEGHGILE